MNLDGPIGEIALQRLTRDFSKELIRLFSNLKKDVFDILDKNFKNLNQDKLLQDINNLFTDDTFFVVTKAKKKDKGIWTGKRYRKLIKKVLKENQKKIASSVLKTTSRNLSRIIKSMIPSGKRRVLKVDFPFVADAIHKSGVLIKTAENGNLISDIQKLAISKVISNTIKESSKKYGLDTKKGKIRLKILKDVKKNLTNYFEGYTKKKPPFGTPKNILTIVRTETRYAINNSKKEFMNIASKSIKEISKNLEGYEIVIEKIWKHNKNLSKNPRKNHMAMNNKKADKSGFFDFVDYKGNRIKISTPHDPILEPEDSINCNCEVIYKVIKKKK